MNTNLLYIAQQRDAQLLHGLCSEGQRVTAAEPVDAERALKGGGYAFILLDLVELRPELLALCVAHRGAAELLVLLTDSDRQARIETLRAGADMCLSRPLSLLELQARMEALSRDHRSDTSAATEQLWLSNSRLLLGRGRPVPVEPKPASTLGPATKRSTSSSPAATATPTAVNAAVIFTPRR